jgi:hypothetical protein
MDNARMSSKALLIGTVVGALAGAGVVWSVFGARVDEFGQRLDDLEAELLDARSEADEMQAVAEAERLRTESARQQLDELKRVRGAAPPPAPMKQHGSETQAKEAPETPARPRVEPEDWDRQALNQAMEALAQHPRWQRPEHPRFRDVERALEVLDDGGEKLLGDILKSDLGDDMRRLAALLIGARKLEPLSGLVVEALAEEKDLKTRRSLVSAVGKLPGDEHVDVLVAAFEERGEGADPLTRQVAISGLARRGHPLALKVARGEVEEKPQLRARVVEGLYARARDGDWKNTELVPVFCKVIETADGDSQRGHALAGLEGLWQKECLPQVQALAANEEVSERIRERAKRFAEALEAGKERPEEAGGFEKASRNAGGRRRPGRQGKRPGARRRRAGPRAPTPKPPPKDGGGGDSGGE